MVGEVADRRAVERQCAGGENVERDAGGGLAGTHDISEGEGGGTAAGRVGGGGSVTEGQCGCPSGDDHHTAEEDGDGDRRAGAVGAVRGRGRDENHRRGGGDVDRDDAVCPERPGSPRRGQSKRGGAVAEVEDLAPVEDQGGRRSVVEVATAITGTHGVSEGERVGAAARRVVRGAAGVQYQLGSARHRDLVGKGDIDREDIAGGVVAVRGGGGDVGRGGVRGQEFPEPSAVGGGREDMELRLDIELRNLGVRQVGTQAAPGGAAVGGGVHAVVVTQVEGAGRRVHLHREGRVRRQVAADIGPGGAAVDGLPDPAAAETGDDRVGCLAVGGVDVDLVDVEAAGEIDTGPARAVVRGHVEVRRTAEVAAGGGVNGAGVARGHGDRVDRQAAAVEPGGSRRGVGRPERCRVGGDGDTRPADEHAGAVARVDRDLGVEVRARQAGDAGGGRRPVHAAVGRDPEVVKGAEAADRGDVVDEVGVLLAEEHLAAIAVVGPGPALRVGEAFGAVVLTPPQGDVGVGRVHRGTDELDGFERLGGRCAVDVGPEDAADGGVIEPPDPAVVAVKEPPGSVEDPGVMVGVGSVAVRAGKDIRPTHTRVG